MTDADRVRELTTEVAQLKKDLDDLRTVDRATIVRITNLISVLKWLRAHLRASLPRRAAEKKADDAHGDPKPD